jgi:hypothetical protein
LSGWRTEKLRAIVDDIDLPDAALFVLGGAMEFHPDLLEGSDLFAVSTNGTDLGL